MVPALDWEPIGSNKQHSILHTRRSSAARNLRNKSRSDENVIMKLLALLKASTKLGSLAGQDNVIDLLIMIKPDVFVPSPPANIKKGGIQVDLKSQ